MEFTTSSISNLRAFEDGLTMVLLVFCIIALVRAKRYVGEGMLSGRLSGLIVGLIPFLLWKTLGFYRRVFMQKSDILYASFHDIGEALEAVSALSILSALIYFFIAFTRK